MQGFFKKLLFERRPDFPEGGDPGEGPPPSPESYVFTAPEDGAELTARLREAAAEIARRTTSALRARGWLGMDEADRLYAGYAARLERLRDVPEAPCREYLLYLLEARRVPEESAEETARGMAEALNQAAPVVRRPVPGVCALRGGAGGGAGNVADLFRRVPRLSVVCRGLQTPLVTAAGDQVLTAAALNPAAVPVLRAVITGVMAAAGRPAFVTFALTGPSALVPLLRKQFDH